MVSRPQTREKSLFTIFLLGSKIQEASTTLVSKSCSLVVISTGSREISRLGECKGVSCVLEPWSGEGTFDDAECTLGATDVETVSGTAGDGTEGEGDGFRILSGCTCL